jgi:hypothetical protein
VPSWSSITSGRSRSKDLRRWRTSPSGAAPTTSTRASSFSDPSTRPSFVRRQTDTLGPWNLDLSRNGGALRVQR